MLRHLGSEVKLDHHFCQWYPQNGFKLYADWICLVVGLGWVDFDWVGLFGFFFKYQHSCGNEIKDCLQNGIKVILSRLTW